MKSGSLKRSRRNQSNSLFFVSAFSFHKFPGLPLSVIALVREKYHEIDQRQSPENIVDGIIHDIEIYPKITLLQSNGKMLFYLLVSHKEYSEGKTVHAHCDFWVGDGLFPFAQLFSQILNNN